MTMGTSTGTTTATSTRTRTRRNREAGAVLLVVMMLMICLFGLGVTALWLTGGNLQVGANVNQRTQALYVAEAGIERARALLNTVPAPNINALLNGTGNPDDDIPSKLDASGMPVGVGAILMDNGTAVDNMVYPPSSFQRSAGTAAAPVATTMGSYTVWIRNDTAECRQGKYLTDGNGSVVIRSRGMAPDNLTTVVIEVAMGGTPPSSTSTTTTSFAPVLCNSGKDACDDNSSSLAGIVAN
jgi:Tfp pilus assembly protein PilX